MEEYAYLLPAMPLIFTGVSTVLFVRLSKFAVQWVPLVAWRLFKRNPKWQFPRNVRKGVTATYSVLVGATAACFFIARDFELFGMHGWHWRVLCALSLPLAAFVFIETFRGKDNVLGRAADWLSRGEIDDGGAK